MKEQLINQLIQFIMSVLGIAGTYLLAVISTKVNAEKKAVVAKTGSDNYNHALKIAKGMYLLLEDDFANVEKAGEQKKDEMGKKLLNVIPELTKEELDSINKEVWNMFNKGILEPIVTPVTPTEPTPVEPTK